MRANHTMTRIGLVLMTALGATAAAAPQDGTAQRKDTAQRNHTAQLLAKARILEEAEHDAEGAARLYAQVAHDGDLEPAQRADAFLALAKLRQRQGEVQAAREALQSAAGGAGPAADAARQLLDALQDPDRVAGSVDLEILRLMGQLRDADGTTARAVLQQIAWFGARAVPRLVEAAREERDFALVSHCATALFMIGGDAVDAWVDAVQRDDDPLRRRAVVRGYAPHRLGARRVAPRRLAGFLDDPAAEVRLEAIDSGVLVDWEQALARVRDEDPRVREAALRWLDDNDWASRLPARDRQGEVTVALVDAIASRAEPAQGATLLARLAAGGAQFPDPEDRLRVALAICGASGESMQPYSSFDGLRGSLAMPDGRDLLVDEVVAVARRVAGLRAADGGARLVVQLFSQARLLAMRTWSRDARGAAFELLALGVEVDAGWFGQTLAPGDWGELFAKLDAFPDAEARQRVLDDAIARDLPAAAFEPLRQWFEARAARPDASGLAMHRALVRLGRFGTEASSAWAVRMLAGGLAALPAFASNAESLQMHRDGLFEGLIAAEGAPVTEALRALAVVDGADFAELRGMALAQLAWRHDVEAAPLFAEAYRLGLAETNLYVPWGTKGSVRMRHRGLHWINAQQGSLLGLGDLPVTYDESWSPAETAAVLEPCLASANRTAWEDARSIRLEVPEGPIYAAFVRHWPRCPDVEMRQKWAQILLDRAMRGGADPRRILLDALADPAASVRETGLRAMQSRHADLRWDDAIEAAVVACLDVPQLAHDALAVLGESGDQGLEPVLQRFLDHPEPTYRSSAVLALFDLVPERALGLTFETLRAEDLRFLMCRIAGRTLDARFVPHLIAALRDENEAIRIAAKEALDAIEFYVSQEQRWRRLLDDAGLDAPNAAEALVRQARDAADAKIRLAAIRSLGTLAVAETLPFLIQLMQDPDPEIRAAAEAAVQRINDGR